MPTHPHVPGRPQTNRRPTRAEVACSAGFLDLVARGRRVVAVGRLAQEVTGARYVRHPSYGGAAAFRDGLAALLSRRLTRDGLLLRFRFGARLCAAFT